MSNEVKTVENAADISEEMPDGAFDVATALRRLASGAWTGRETFLNNLSVPFWMKDVRGRYVVCNVAFESFAGRERSQVIGKTDFDFASRSFADAAQRQDLQTLTSMQVMTYALLQVPNGRAWSSDGKVTKIAIRNSDGEPTGIASVATFENDTSVPRIKSEKPQTLAQIDKRVTSKDPGEILNPYLERLKGTGARFALVVFHIAVRQGTNQKSMHSVPTAVYQKVFCRLELKLNSRGYIYRLDDEQIAVLLHDVHSESDLETIVKQLGDETFFPVEADGDLFQVLATSAQTLADDTDIQASDVLQRVQTGISDHAKQRAAGLPLISRPQGHMPREAAEYELQADMASGIENHDFTAYFQPKMDISTQQVIGAEALVRWIHPKRGLIPPSMFIPMAEQIGLQQVINTQIWRQSLEFAIQLNENRADARRVAINISAFDLQSPTFLSSFTALLSETGCPANFVEFEITETALKGRTEQLESHLAGLAELGIGLAIDDFGTGNLAFEALNHFPIQTLKIDRVFIKDVATQDRTARLVRAMCLMADELGLVTVAEGVETLMESELVKQIGCKQGQGFFWQRAVPAKQFFEWLEQRKNVQ